MRQRGGELPRRVVCLAEIEAVIERLRVDRGGAFQMRDRPHGLVCEPECDTQMIVRGSEPGVESEGAFEMRDGLFATVEDGEQKADLILHTCAAGIGGSGLLPNRKCSCCVAARAGGRGA